VELGARKYLHSHLWLINNNLNGGMEMNFKRILVVLLVLMLITGSLPMFASTTGNEESAYATKTLELDSRYTDYDDNQEIYIMIELEDEPIIEYATDQGIYVDEIDDALFDQMTQELLDDQTLFRDEMLSDDIEFDFLEDYTNVVNAISVKTTFGEAKKIESLRFPFTPLFSPLCRISAKFYRMGLSGM